MCDRIIMPDGSEIETIDEDELCLCGNSQKEILTWIIDHIPDLNIGDELDIAHTPFGWEVSIKNQVSEVKVMVKIACPNCNKEYELESNQKPYTSYKCPECGYSGIMKDV